MPDRTPSPVKPQPFSALTRRVPHSWDVPLVIRFDAAFGYHDIKGQAVMIESDLVTEAADSLGSYRGLRGNFIGVAALLLAKADEYGIVLNPLDLIEPYIGIGRRTGRTILWALEATSVAVRPQEIGR